MPPRDLFRAPLPNSFSIRVSKKMLAVSESLPHDGFNHATMTPAPEILTSVRDLYERGLYLKAHDAALQHGPLRNWTGGAARTLAARLARHLGAPRLARWHLALAWREEPDDPEVRYYYGWNLLERHGPYETWCFLKRCGDMPEAGAEARSSWYSFHAQVAGQLRDFDAAEVWLARAEEAAPDSPWVPVARASVLQDEDRYGEALQASYDALARRPWYRPAVQAAAHLLTLGDRNDEALQLMIDSLEHVECAGLAGQLAALQIELQQFAAARDSLDRFERLSPLMETKVAQFLAALRADVAYGLGDIEQAIACAKQSEDGFHLAVAERLADPARSGGQRVLLPVGFVRQHHMTCVPATLSAISRFWSKPADHLQVAEEICYNGTSSYNERRWAEENGWAAREFTVTEDAAVQLIDRGVPFTLTTINPGNAHLQAVVGYDGRRGTLLIRDPYMRNCGEANADKFLERYRAHGPRGMALAPVDQAALLDGLELPDAEHWDQLHRLDGALIAHRRETAREIWRAMHDAAPGHRLTCEARRRLALYDANPAELLAAVEQLLQLFPDEQVYQLARLSCLRDLARRDERLETYRRLCDTRESHPMFWQQYAQELRLDARQHDEAMFLLKRAIRYWPQEPGSYYILGHVLWDQRRFEEALELYRFAACLDDKDEQLAETYFAAARCLKQTEIALKCLENRFERFGSKSSLPARTLEWAYRRLERTDEALHVIDEALVRRPDDGDLMLHAADCHAGTSDAFSHRAAEFLERARDKTPRARWLRTAARLAGCRGDLKESLALWREVLKLQPLAIDAHRAVAQVLAETQGTQAALDHLRRSAEAFPTCYPLHELWIQWLRDEPPEVAEPVIRRVIEHNPADAWARRELGFLLARQRRLEEAWAEAEEAFRIDPTNASCFHLRGEIFAIEGKLDEARAAYREAIRLSVDNDYAIGELIRCCDTPAERREALAFVREELVRQVIFGDGLLAFRRHAAGTLDPEELLASLREGLQARPDLWHAWSAMVQQLLAMDRLDEAADLASQATERFPLLPRLWFDRALVCRARLDWDGEVAALQSAYQINPGWGIVARALAEAHERRGDQAAARTTLEQVIARDPLDPVNHGCLADLLWRAGEREAALSRVEHAVQLAPGYNWAWSALRDWLHELGRPEKAAEVARQVVARRPGETRSWLILARTLGRPEDLDERLAALDRAIELNPRCVDAYDLKAALLAQSGRHDEALAACRPPIWQTPPAELRARAAWIAAEQGRIDDAISTMRAALADEPGFYGGWSRLADWLRQQQDHAAYLEAAHALVRIDPQCELSFGYLGEALLLNGDRDGAREAYRRAFELSPTYEFAGFSLFDLQLENEALDDAEKTLAVLRTHVGGPFVTARGIQIARRYGDRTVARRKFEELCRASHDHPWPLGEAVDELFRAGWPEMAIEVLEQALDAPDANPQVGDLWVRACVHRGKWKHCQNRLKELVGRGEIGRRAIYTWLELSARAGRRRRVSRFIGANGDWLRADTFLWGAVGYALTTLRDYRTTARWMADWRDRTDARPWMLVNAVEGLRHAGRLSEAAEASRFALTLPADNGTPLHQLWLASDEVLACDFASARSRLETVDPSSIDQDYRFLHALITAVLEVAEAPAADRTVAFRSARDRIEAAVAGYAALGREKARRRFYRRCVKHVADHCGGAAARLWYWMRLLAS